MTSAGDEENLRQPEAAIMTTMDADADKYKKANELLSAVDVNIVKTAMLRKQMPAKCAQLLARQCRLRFKSIVCRITLLTQGLIYQISQGRGDGPKVSTS